MSSKKIKDKIDAANYDFGSRENLIEFLKRNLSVDISTFGLSRCVDIEVEVSLDGDVVKQVNSDYDWGTSDRDYFS
jgi:hypothetical protein